MIEDHYKDVLRLVHPYPVPPGDFDPMRASNRELAQYGLPERPDSASEPEAFAFWQEMLSPQTKIVEPEFPDGKKGDPRTLLAQRHRQGPETKRGFSHRENSRNWSGAYITPMPRPDRLLRVVGAWAVPGSEAPHVPPSGANRLDQEYRSSTWIGIGGNRSYNTLPQIGTSQNVTLVNGRPTGDMVAWWQWWVKGRPEHHVPIPILNFDVCQGDRIVASVTIEAPSPGEVRFNLKNQRTGTFVAFKVCSPADILPLGSTAEWIHERPAKFESREKYPMPHCSKVVFRHCLAWSARELGAPMVLQRLEKNARLISMADIFEAPHRSARVSLPEKKGSTELHVVYREAGT